MESGITTLESEFLANIVLPGGGTVGQWLATQAEEACASGGCCRCWTQDHFSTMQPREIT